MTVKLKISIERTQPGSEELFQYLLVVSQAEMDG